VEVRKVGVKVGRQVGLMVGRQVGEDEGRWGKMRENEGR